MIINSVFRLAIICFLVWPVNAAPAQSTGSVSDPNHIVRQVCSEIITGDFAAARKLLDENTTIAGKNIERLAAIVSEYETMKKAREQNRQTIYQEQIAKIEEFSSAETEKIQDVEKVFAVVAKALRYADEEQKKALLERPLMNQLTAEALKEAARFEKKGNWNKAYSNCYHWLTMLDKGNREYSEHAEVLVEKSAIEISLKDDSCKKSIARYKGIKKSMLKRAMTALDFRYATEFSYAEMAEKALNRCRLLGEVLSESSGKIAYKVTPEQAVDWSGGLDAIAIKLAGPRKFAGSNDFFEIFDDVLALNKITLELPDEVIVAHFSESALSALDPYTKLIWPDYTDDFEKSMTQQFDGIGIRMSKVSKALKVVSLIPNTPAYSSGLDVGDLITAVDGEPTDDMSTACAVIKISGARGTKVTLTVKHPDDDKTEDITITRDKIIVPTVQGKQWTGSGSSKGKLQQQHMIDPNDGIGYIRISNFAEKTFSNVKDILGDLESSGLKGLVIDLRFNTGGFLTAAVETVDMFVDKGMILKSQPRWGLSSYWPAHSKNTHPNYPVVVLINGSSASASEIVAGALQDPLHNRATIVGSRSFGKCSVQEITSFPGGGAQLKYTTAHYHLPSGERVKSRYIAEKHGKEDWGITPGVEVKLLDDEQKRMFKLQQANEVLVKADHDNSTRAVKRYTTKELIDADAQLATGLLVLKSKMILAATN